MEQMENLCHDENTNSIKSNFLKYRHLLLAHTSDVKGIDEKITSELEKLREDNRQKHLQLEDDRKYLQQREDELVEKERIIHKEKKLKLKKSLHRRLSFFGQLVDKCYTSRKEAESIKREINMLYKRRVELEEKLNAKSFEDLQIEIRKLELGLGIIEGDEDMDLQEKLEDMQCEVIEIGELLQELKEFAKVYIFEIQRINTVLQDARQELINGLKTYPTRSHICVKTMGVLDMSPFISECYSEDKMKENETKYASISRSLVEDPNWHPFKVVKIGCGNRGILDEEDEKIVKLKEECNEEQYQAVVTALYELKEYKLSGGRDSVMELWNDKGKRKASLKEGIEYLLEEWKIQKRRKV